MYEYMYECLHACVCLCIDICMYIHQVFTLAAISLACSCSSREAAKADFNSSLCFCILLIIAMLSSIILVLLPTDFMNFSTYMYECMYVKVCMSARISTCMRVCMSICMSISMSICTGIYMIYVCMYVCMHV